MTRLSVHSVLIILTALTAAALCLPEDVLATWQLAFRSQENALRDSLEGFQNSHSPTLERDRAPRDAVAELADRTRMLHECQADNYRLQAELERLRRSQQELSQVMEFLPLLRFAPAMVTGRSGLAGTDDLIINRGLADGIAPGDAVLQGQNLAGQVMEALPHAARVRVVIHPDIVVPARLGQSRSECYVRGGADGGCEVVFIGLVPDAVAGEMVFTSGLLGYFPPNVLVAEILEQPVCSRDQKTWVAPCRPRANLAAVEQVLVVRSTQNTGVPSTWLAPRAPGAGSKK